MTPNSVQYYDKIVIGANFAKCAKIVCLMSARSPMVGKVVSPKCSTHPIVGSESKINHPAFVFYNLLVAHKVMLIIIFESTYQCQMRHVPEDIYH